MNVFKCITWTTRLDKILDRVQPGDTVRFHRGLFIHHAIYVGSGRAIHHHLGPNDGEVIEVTLEYLAKGDLMRVMRVTDTSFSPEEVIRRARSQIGPLPYSLHGGNCEHFTSWVYYGVRESRQLSGLCRYELRLLQYVKHHGGDKESEPEQQQHKHQQQQKPETSVVEHCCSNNICSRRSRKALGDSAMPDVNTVSGDCSSSTSSRGISGGSDSGSVSGASFVFIPPRPPKYRHTKNPAMIACNHARSWLKVLAVQSVVGLAAFPLYKCSHQADLLQRLGGRLKRQRRQRSQDARDS